MSALTRLPAVSGDDACSRTELTRSPVAVSFLYSSSAAPSNGSLSSSDSARCLVTMGGIRSGDSTRGFWAHAVHSTSDDTNNQDLKSGRIDVAHALTPV